jgi:phage FluMu protein Com
MESDPRKSKMRCDKCGRYVGEFELTIDPVPIAPIGILKNIKCPRCNHRTTFTISSREKEDDKEKPK